MRTDSPSTRLVRSLTDPTAILAVSVFLSVIGFTLILPVVPFLVGQYVPESRIAVQSGLLVSVYGLCMFLSAPVLGALSDRFGRRVVLIVSLAGSAVGYLVTGFGGALSVLFAGRIIDGLTAGNISTVFASIADVTPPAERGRVYGLLGAVAGAGFMVGPALGGLLGSISPATPLFAAAAASALNLVWVQFALAETLSKERRAQTLPAACLNPLGMLARMLRVEAVRRALAPAFLFYFAGAMMQTTITLLLKDRFGFGPLGVGALLCLVGIMDILSQGVLTRILSNRLPARSLARRGLAVNAAGFLAIAGAALMPLPFVLFAAVTVFTLGDGLFQPAMSGLIANAAPDGAQGAVQGANQSQQSIARMVGPVLGTALYAFDPGAPYWAGAAIIVIGLLALRGKAPDASADALALERA